MTQPLGSEILQEDRQPEEGHALRAITYKTILVLVGGAMVLALAGVAGAGNGSGNKNGDFEMGDFTKWVTYCDVCWTTPGDPGGNWFVSGKKETPINKFSWFGPMQKEFECLVSASHGLVFCFSCSSLPSPELKAFPGIVTSNSEWTLQR